MNTILKRLADHFYLIKRLRIKIDVQHRKLDAQRDELLDLGIRVAALESLMRKIDVHNHQFPDPLAPLFEPAGVDFRRQETGQYFFPLNSHLYGKRTSDD